MASRSVAIKLKILRRKQNMTQKDVYEKLNISQSTFSSWETGKSEPDIITFLRLCRLYKVDDILYEFLGVKQNQNSDITSEMFSRLDDEDKAEIRGEMKQMLKSPKYNSVKSTDSPVCDFDAATDVMPFLTTSKFNKN